MSLEHLISFFTSLIRGRDYYGKYRKMYNRDLEEIPSFKLISDLAFGKILDVGCGIGYSARLFDNYVGIDANKEAITIAKKNTDGNYIIASASNLPFRSNTFDTCISYDFIEHVKDIDHVLTEIRRIASKVIISCVDFSSYYRFFTYDETHESLFAPEELFKLMRKYFRLVRLFRASGLFMVPHLVNNFLSRYLPNQIVLEALP